MSSRGRQAARALQDADAVCGWAPAFALVPLVGPRTRCSLYLLLKLMLLTLGRALVSCWVAACPADLPALAHISSAPPVICPLTNNAGILTPVFSCIVAAIVAAECPECPGGKQ